MQCKRSKFQLHRPTKTRQKETSITLLISSYHIDELKTCNIYEKKARDRGRLKLHTKICSKDKINLTTIIMQVWQEEKYKWTGRTTISGRTTIREPLTFDLQINYTYEQIISWPRNIFTRPKSSIEKQFIKKTDKTFSSL